MADVEELTQPAIGLLHPGEMGAAVGRSVVGAANLVRWVPACRGPDTM
jgi:hypothetical protein